MLNGLSHVGALVRIASEKRGDFDFQAQVASPVKMVAKTLAEAVGIHRTIGEGHRRAR